MTSEETTAREAWKTAQELGQTTDADLETFIDELADDVATFDYDKAMKLACALRLESVTLTSFSRKYGDSHELTDDEAEFLFDCCREQIGKQDWDSIADALEDGEYLASLGLGNDAMTMIENCHTFARWQTLN